MKPYGLAPPYARFARWRSRACRRSSSSSGVSVLASTGEAHEWSRRSPGFAVYFWPVALRRRLAPRVPMPRRYQGPAHVSGIPSPCATMAPLLRFAPPGCNALHVEGIPSLRGGLGRSAPAGRRMRSRAKPASTAGLRLGGSWARSSGGMSDDAGCELPRLASAIGGAQNGTQGRSRAGHPPLSSASVELRRLALDPRACNTGVYNPRELLNWGSID